jgi:hypothetical protein
MELPQAHPPRWTSAAIATAIDPLHAPIAELETQLASLKASTT